MTRFGVKEGAIQKGDAHARPHGVDRTEIRMCLSAEDQRLSRRHIGYGDVEGRKVFEQQIRRGEQRHDSLEFRNQRLSVVESPSLLKRKQILNVHVAEFVELGFLYDGLNGDGTETYSKKKGDQGSCGGPPVFACVCKESHFLQFDKSLYKDDTSRASSAKQQTLRFVAQGHSLRLREEPTPLKIRGYHKMSQSLLPPSLPPSLLYSEEAKRDATRIRIYNMVLTQIYTKIKAIARIPGNQKFLWYVVPEFIPGTPRFDIGDAILYIVWNLRNVGYAVTYTHPNLLGISWAAHDEQYRTRTSPWSVVLHTAREAALKEPTIVSHVLKPAPASILVRAPEAKAPEVKKRQTPLKKTTEFRPEAGMPIATNPSVASALYGTATPATSSRLPGQLGERHVSFV